MRRTGAMLATTLVGLGLALVPVTPAAAVDPSCNSDAAPSPPIEALPWAQQLYDPPNRIWPFSVGVGVTVAVLDSGVDATHPQLVDSVLPGVSLVPETPPTGNIDCVPFGTAVASLVAAQPVAGFGFAGLAPAATILPVRVSDTTHTNPGDDLLSPAILAAGIDFAVAGGADVIAASAVTYVDDPALAAAVDRAVAAGVVVVAAAGDGHDDDRDGPLGPTRLASYPALYDGVIGVGAVGIDGMRSQSSQIGPYVDLVAPGLDVTAASFGGHASYNGTSIAVGFVAAAAALMLGQPGSALAGLGGSELVDALSGQLFAAADGPVGGPVGGAPSPAYGNGLVDPYRAMVEAIGDTDPEALAGREPPPRDLAAERLAAQRSAANRSAVLSAVGLGGLVLVVLAAAFVLPRALRRRWRPGRNREFVPDGEAKRPEFLPGEMLFRTSRADKAGPG